MDENEPPTVPLEPAGAAEPAAAGAGSPASAPPDPSARRFLRSHTVGIAIAAGILAVIVVAGGTAWGVSAAVAAAQTAVPAGMHSTHAGALTAKKAHARAAHAAHGAVGTISAISGDTWTLHAASGATVTVTVDGATAFGTKSTPASEDSFVVGDRVAAQGQRTGEHVTATRIVHLPLKQHATTSPAPTPTPTAGA